MAFDGIIANMITNELKCSLINGKVNKIFEPNRNEILIGIYSNAKNYMLNISIDSGNYRICLTDHQKENPKNALNFVMVLRKHLISSTIKNIYMNSFDRVIYIDFETHNELNDIITKTLAIELMGKHSNIVLYTKENNKIIDSLRHLNIEDNSSRNIGPGYTYETITSNKKDITTIPSFEEFLRLYNEYINMDSENQFKDNNNKNICNIIANIFNGISANNVKYFCESNNIDINIENNSNLEFSLNNIYYYLKDISNVENFDKNVSYKFEKILVSEESRKHDYYVGNTKVDLSSLENSFFLDDYYYKKEIKDNFISFRNNLLKTILTLVDKLKNRLQIINSKLEDCDHMDEYKLYGELITSNLYKLNNVYEDKVVLENYYDNNKPITIPLDQNLSANQNAKAYFKKYKKLVNTSNIVAKQKELINEQIKYLNATIEDIQNAVDISDLLEIKEEMNSDLHLENDNDNSNSKKKSNKKPNYPTTYIIDGFTVLVGKNNKQNDFLTNKLAKPNDLWFHVKDDTGSHVVLKLEKSLDKYDKSKIDKMIYRCATIAAYFSHSKLSSNVPVDYTLIKNVRKPNGANLGFVIYNNNRTLFVNPKEP